MKQVKKAIIPVAGYGTRLLPETKALPKPMYPVLNKPSVQYIIQEAVDSGIEEVILIVGQHKEILKAHFSPAPELENVLKTGGKQDLYNSVVYPQNMCKITYIEQTEQLGTGHAVLIAEEHIGNEPFAVLFGDDVMANHGGKPVLRQLIDAYEKRDETVIAVKNVGFELVSKYASVEYKSNSGREYDVTKITEKPAPGTAKSDLSPLGRYVLKEGFFDVLRRIPRGKNGEYQLTDALDLEAKERGLIAYNFEGSRYDMGDVFGCLHANVETALSSPELKDKVKAYLKNLDFDKF